MQKLPESKPPPNTTSPNGGSPKNWTCCQRLLNIAKSKNDFPFAHMHLLSQIEEHTGTIDHNDRRLTIISALNFTARGLQVRQPQATLDVRCHLMLWSHGIARLDPHCNIQLGGGGRCKLWKDVVSLCFECCFNVDGALLLIHLWLASLVFSIMTAGPGALAFTQQDARGLVASRGIYRVL